MSAYMCSDKHINTLVTFAAAHDVSYWHAPTRNRIKVRGNEQHTSLLLQAANARSVNYRYAHNPDAQCDDEPIVFKPVGFLYPGVVIIKQCHCLAYQSCEVDDWDSSQAKAILDAIENKAITLLPGYDAAPWGL